MEDQEVQISVVIPFKDEAESIPLLSDELSTVIDNNRFCWECIWIDDGSTDNSSEKVKYLMRSRPDYQLIQFDKNYGQSAALGCGFKKSRGKIIVTLDADLQNDPADIPGLLDLLLDSNIDMVNGIRKNRRDSMIRLISSRIANKYRNKLTGSSVTDVGCSIRVFYRRCVENVPIFKGMHRFLPTLVEMQGFRITEAPVNHRPRIKGTTKYGINNRLWVGIIDTLAVAWMQHRFVYPKTKLV
jgi:glycosyltransferase involved in cell wall biosynthesis